MIAQENPRMKSFVGTVRKLSADEKIAMACEARRRYSNDMATMEAERKMLEAEIEEWQQKSKVMKQEFEIMEKKAATMKQENETMKRVCEELKAQLLKK